MATPPYYNDPARTARTREDMEAGLALARSLGNAADHPVLGDVLDKAREAAKMRRKIVGGEK